MMTAINFKNIIFLIFKKVTNKMSRRRKQQDIPPDYYGSIDYGMDEYEDPIDCMSPEEIRRLADYVEMIQGGRYANRHRKQADDDLPVNPDTIYPEEYSDDEEDEEENEDDEETENEDEPED